MGLIMLFFFFWPVAAVRWKFCIALMLFLVETVIIAAVIVLWPLL